MLFNDSIADEISKESRKKYVEVMNLLHATADYLTDNAKRVRGVQYRCHSICDALAANIEDLTVVDGYYMGLMRASPEKREYNIITCQHSWLQTPDQTIIDPYPVGTLNVNPLIFPPTGKYKDYGYSHYLPDPQVRKDVYKRWLYLETIRWKSVMRAVRKKLAKKK